MKSKITTVLSVVAVLMIVLCITGPAEAGPTARSHLQSGAPTVVSYQGQVTVGGTPYDGTGYFKFAVVNADGTTTYWSNDGTSIDGGKPTGSVSLTVTDGLFNVLLGDTTLTNMTEPLTAAVFDETECYLRVWFSADDSDYQSLSPDRRIGAMPYALQAQEAADSDRLDGQHGVYYQARVSGTCPVGSTVRAINADGTVVCQAQAGALNRAVAPTSNISTTLDSIVGAELYASVTIGTDGLPLISYSNGGDLKVAHCGDVACTSANINTVDSTSVRHTSVTIGADGLPLISYRAGSSLKVAHCGDVACTSAISTTLDSTGGFTSVTIGADGLGLISYYGSSADLKVAHCEDSACTSAYISTLDSTGNVGEYTSVTIGADGLGLISYHDATNEVMKVAHCDDVVCSSATANAVGGPVGTHTSVTIGADRLGLISYYGGSEGLRVAHCEDPACTIANNTTLDSDGLGNIGRYTSVTIGADGLGLISYYDGTNQDLKLAYCEDVACTSAIINTVDCTGDVGQYTSVTIGTDGLTLISYYDDTNYALKVFHCGSPFCTPYFRRR